MADLKKRVREARATLRKLSTKYMEEYVQIITDIDNSLEVIEDASN